MPRAISIAGRLAVLAVLGAQPVIAQRSEAEVPSPPMTVEWRRNAAGIEGVRATFLLRTTRQALWNCLVDYARFREIFRNVKEVRTLRESDSHAEVEFVVNAVAGDVRYVLDRRYVERERSITWTKLSGDLNRIEGAWTIADGPRPGILLVTYESYVEFPWYVPSLLARPVVTSELEAMADALRRRLEVR